MRAAGARDILGRSPKFHGHRSRTARELRQEMAALERDVAGGDPSMQQRMLVERAVAVNAFCRACEERMAGGDAIEVALWLTATNTLGRLARQLGIQRYAKPVAKGLDAYLASKPELRIEAKPGPTL